MSVSMAVFAPGLAAWSAWAKQRYVAGQQQPAHHSNNGYYASLLHCPPPGSDSRVYSSLQTFLVPLRDPYLLFVEVVVLVVLRALQGHL